MVADTRPRDFRDYPFLGSAQEAEAFLNAPVPATMALEWTLAANPTYGDMVIKHIPQRLREEVREGITEDRGLHFKERLPAYIEALGRALTKLSKRHELDWIEQNFIIDGVHLIRELNEYLEAHHRWVETHIIAGGLDDFEEDEHPELDKELVSTLTRQLLLIAHLLTQEQQTQEGGPSSPPA